MQRYALLAISIGFCFIMAGPSTVAGDAKDDAVKKDRKKFVGVWQVVALEVDGNKSSEEDAKKIIVINEADGKWAIEVEGKVVTRGSSVIDPMKKPKTVDLVETEGDNKGKTALGIYELGDDTRKVCVATAGKSRPTEFSASAGSGYILTILKRVKK